MEKYGKCILVILGVYLFMRYLSPLLSPFLIAFLVAAGLNRAADRLPFRGKKHVLGGILLVAVLLVFLLLAGILADQLLKKCTELAGRLPYYEGKFGILLNQCCVFAQEHFGMDAASLETYVLKQTTALTGNLETKLLPAMLKEKGVSSLTGFIGSLAVTVVAVFLILKDYDGLVFQIRNNRELNRVMEVAGKVLFYLKTYLRAQFIILLCIGTSCALTLWILGVKGGIFYGLITGIMDMLPFVGTGIMLLPLTVLRLLSGQYLQAFVILCLYAVCALIREFMEPKLIGERVGILPVGILFSVFAGVRLFGILGIIKGPVGCIVICEVCKYIWGESNAEESS